ncbi:MAG: porin [Octadecabacter sp.]|nr:porin [Octadecabacter sp.]
MKNVLLASTAVVLFAGAAAAEITFSGSADLGYNDNAAGDNDGFYSDLDVTAGLSVALDNGLTAAASLNLDDLGNGTDDGTVYELSLTSETAGLYYGDTNFAAQNVWVGAGDMAGDNFSEADGEEALRGEATFGAVSAQVSYALADSAGVRNTGDDLQQLSIGAAADFGNVNVVVAYQEAFSTAADGTAYNTANGDINDAEVFGLSVGTSFGGADVRLAFADNGTDESTGISVAYPVGPVTINASYAENSTAGERWDLGATYANGPVSVTVETDENDDWSLEGSYDAGNGIMAYAGVVDAGDDFYVAGTYDLGSGASLLVSFVEDGGTANGDDEVGANDYQIGTTVEVSFAF